MRCTPIGADERIVLLGSCFADNMGRRLAEYGFDVVSNPLGPLFNPFSTAAIAERALDGRLFRTDDLTRRGGTYHALFAAARYHGDDSALLTEAINSVFTPLCDAMNGACTLFVTFGTAYTYRLLETGDIVANCHKLHASEFSRERMSIEAITTLWRPLLKRLDERGIRTIFTVSPVRHVADGLHANNISKATLLMAVESLEAEYFPAYEILCDDLRDYRYYASDMKHPSDSAIDYIYEKFAETYFSTATKETARLRHADFLRSAHRPTIPIL